jgi:hypothetical protein
MKQHGRRQDEREVTETVGDERPETVAVGRVAARVVTQEEIQQHPDQVPGDDQGDEIGGRHHDDQHGRH